MRLFKKGQLGGQTGMVLMLAILVISLIVGGAIINTLRESNEITTQNNQTRGNTTVAGPANSTSLSSPVLFNISMGGDRRLENGSGQIIVFQRNNRSQVLTAGTHYFVLSLGGTSAYAVSNARVNVTSVNWNVTENGLNITVEYNVTQRNSTVTKIASQSGQGLTNYSALLITAGIIMIMIVIVAGIVALGRGI